MNLDELKIKKVKYKMENIVVYVGSTTFNVSPTMLSNLYIEKDYENTVLPYVQISLNVPNWLYRQMQKDSQNIRVGFTLKYGFFDDSNNQNVAFTTELHGKFYALIPDASVISNEEKLAQVEKEAKQYNSGYTFNEMALVDMLLVNENYYRNLRKTCNQIFSSCTPADALTYVLNQGGYSNILLSPPNNNRSYSQFKVTPLPLIKQIKRICYEYNLHDKGTIIFFDLDRGYIIDKQAKCTAYVTNEYTTTNLMALANYQPTSGQITGFGIDKKSKSYVVSMAEGEYSFQNNANTSTISNIQIIDTDSGSVSSTSVGKSGTTETYVFSGGSNTASQIANSLRETNSILTLKTTSCILSALTPNKTFAVSIDNPKSGQTGINGIYRISNYICEFQLNGDYLVPYYQMTFVKS